MIARATAEYVAARFGLAPGKGSLAVGADADLALVDLGHRSTLDAADLHYRHAHSPYVGRAFCGQVVRTLVRGLTVWQEGQAVGRRWGG